MLVSQQLTYLHCYLWREINRWRPPNSLFSLLGLFSHGQNAIVLHKIWWPAFTFGFLFSSKHTQKKQCTECTVNHYFLRCSWFCNWQRTAECCHAFIHGWLVLLISAVPWDGGSEGITSLRDPRLLSTAESAATAPVQQLRQQQRQTGRSKGRTFSLAATFFKVFLQIWCCWYADSSFLYWHSLTLTIERRKVLDWLFVLSLSQFLLINSVFWGTLYCSNTIFLLTEGRIRRETWASCHILETLKCFSCERFQDHTKTWVVFIYVGLT